jgi:fructosamine-3-kinase
MDPRETDLHSDWIKAIQNHLDSPCELHSVGFIGGGSINDARRINTSKGNFFAKLNNLDEYPGMFECEADGLEFLRAHSQFRIPETIGTGSTENVQWIIMRLIQPAPKKEGYWNEFAKKLADFHRQTSETFGYHRDNYLGSLPQANNQKSTWTEFYASERIEPQLKMAKDKGLASAEMVRLFEKMLGRMERYFPTEPAAALHGDLWTGNFMTDDEGSATIFDPAVYYGHREMDIAMSRLFGSFGDEFYRAYQKHFPMEAGWEDRMDIANLYPLLAHLNLFGGGYAAQIMTILRKRI